MSFFPFQTKQTNQNHIKKEEFPSYQKENFFLKGKKTSLLLKNKYFPLFQKKLEQIDKDKRNNIRIIKNSKQNHRLYSQIINKNEIFITNSSNSRNENQQNQSNSNQFTDRLDFSKRGYFLNRLTMISFEKTKQKPELKSLLKNRFKDIIQILEESLIPIESKRTIEEEMKIEELEEEQFAKQVLKYEGDIEKRMNFKKVIGTNAIYKEILMKNFNDKQNLETSLKSRVNKEEVNVNQNIKYKSEEYFYKSKNIEYVQQYNKSIKTNKTNKTKTSNNQKEREEKRYNTLSFFPKYKFKLNLNLKLNFKKKQKEKNGLLINKKNKMIIDLKIKNENACLIKELNDKERRILKLISQ